MQESVPGDIGDADGHPGDGQLPSEERDRFSRHKHRANTPKHQADDADATGPDTTGPDTTAADVGTTGERLGRQVWAWGKELLTIVVIAVVLSFLIKTFLFRAFYIPSGSMEETLQIQDRIFVNLLVPEPFGLKRGDIVVFKDTQGWLQPEAAGTGSTGWLGDAATFIGLAPDSSQQHLVKRVIGMPGDRVICCGVDGKLSINGQPISEPYLFPGAAPSETTFDATVPEGHLWVMGDHRNNSLDSRHHQSLNNTGFVPISDVEGRAVVIGWPVTRWGVLGNYPKVFTEVPDPETTSVGAPQPIPAGQ